MELNLEALGDKHPLEALGIIYHQQVDEGVITEREVDIRTYGLQLMDYCIPVCTKEKSTELIEKLKLTGQIHPWFFYFLQKKFNDNLRKISNGHLDLG